MFERFTEKAIKVIMLAQEEARRLGHNFVDTEFLLLGLIGEGTGIAAKSLKSSGVNLKDARIEVEKVLGRGSGFVAVEIPFTANAKRQLEFGWDEARKLGHNYIGTEHLLLGLLRLDESAGYKVLISFSIDPQHIRTQVIRLLGEVGAESASVKRDKPRSPMERMESDDIEITVNDALFEVIVSALPKKAQPLALKLGDIIISRQRAIRDSELEIAVGLRAEEKKLLEQLSEYASSPEIYKLTLELEEMRFETDQAIRDHEFDKAASLREKESELSKRFES